MYIIHNSYVYNSETGGYMSGGYVRGYMSGGICPGIYVRGYMSMGICPGGICPDTNATIPIATNITY